MKWIIDVGVIFAVGRLAIDFLPNNQEFAFAFGAVAIFYFVAAFSDIWEILTT